MQIQRVLCRMTQSCKGLQQMRVTAMTYAPRDPEKHQMGFTFSAYKTGILSVNKESKFCIKGPSSNLICFTSYYSSGWGGGCRSKTFTLDIRREESRRVSSATNSSNYLIWFCEMHNITETLSESADKVFKCKH